MLSISNSQAINEGYYQGKRCQTPSVPATSAPILLERVDPAPASIVSAPMSVTIDAGTTAVFNASFLGSAPLSIQWYLDGTILPGATMPQLVITNAEASNMGTYQVSVSNFDTGAISAGATLTVLPAAPTFVVQPISQGVLAGNNVAFNASAIGTDASPDFIEYLWYFQNGLISGQTNSLLQLISVGSSQTRASILSLLQMPTRTASERRRPVDYRFAPVGSNGIVESNRGCRQHCCLVLLRHWNRQSFLFLVFKRAPPCKHHECGTHHFQYSARSSRSVFGYDHQSVRVDFIHWHRQRAAASLNG